MAATKSDDKIDVRIGEKLKARVEKAAKTTGVNRAEWVRLALIEFLDRNPTPSALMKTKIAHASRV